MIIRTATEKDIDAIMKIETDAFIPEIQEEASVFLERIKCNPELFLLFDDDSEVPHKTFGYLCGEILSKIPTSACELALGHSPSKNTVKDGYLYLSSFAILSSYKGKGLGKLLFNKGVEQMETSVFGCNNKPQTVLLVNEAWHGPKHIYETAGFEQINIFKDFFPTSEENKTAGILMIRK